MNLEIAYRHPSCGKVIVSKETKDGQNMENGYSSVYMIKYNDTTIQLDVKVNPKPDTGNTKVYCKCNYRDKDLNFEVAGHSYPLMPCSLSILISCAAHRCIKKFPPEAKKDVGEIILCALDAVSEAERSCLHIKSHIATLTKAAKIMEIAKQPIKG